MICLNQKKALSIALLSLSLLVFTGCGRRSSRAGFIPLPREIAPSVPAELVVRASPSSASVGESILIEASWGNVSAFDFEFSGPAPRGVTFLDNQSGFRSVRVTSSEVISSVTVRVRPTGQTSPTQAVSISFTESPLTPPPTWIEPPLHCQLIPLSGTSSQVGASGVFRITEQNRNLPIQITRVWTQDSFEQGFFWNNLSNYTTLTFRSPGFKTVYVSARRSDMMSIYSGASSNLASDNFECTAQFNIYVAPRWVYIPVTAPPVSSPPPIEYRWVATNGGTCSSVCQEAGMLSTAFSDGSFCASGELRPAGASGISYQNGTWGRGTEFTAGQSIGRYCYGSKPGRNQKQDRDRTDITVACYCKTR